MPEATEVVYLTLRSGLDPEESGSKAAQDFDKCAATLSQQKGFIRQYWGHKLEDPSIFIGTIDWEDVQDHIDFANSEAYRPFTADLAEIFDFAAAAPRFYHVNFAGDSVPPREAPVTEVVPFNIDAASTDEQKSALEDSVLKFTPFCASVNSPGVAVGWALEEQEHKDAPGGKVKLLQALIGWQSVEDHVAATKREDFMPLVQPIRGQTIPAQEGKGMFHVKLQKK